MITSCQCKLRKVINGFEIFQTAWIPSSKAKIGKFLKIKINGEWQDGWEVIERGKFSIPEDYISKHSQDYKNQREASDI